MKMTVLLIIVTLFCQISFGQNQVFTIEELINETNKLLLEYDKYRPSHEYYSLQKLNLTNFELQELFEDDSDGIFNDTKDSVSSFVVIGLLKEKIIKSIENVISHDEFVGNKINFFDSNLISIVKSDDDKLYNFTFDEKVGGSYLSKVSIMHFTDLKDDKKKHNAYKVFDSDGYEEIYTINSEEGIKYILTGGAKTCSMCFKNYIHLVKFDENVFVLDFDYSTYSRSWDHTIFFNPIEKTINIAYETDDLNPKCICENLINYNKSRIGYNEEYFNQTCDCLFKFTGQNFELVLEE